MQLLRDRAPAIARMSRPPTEEATRDDEQIAA
jgi:hypothetical protein